MSLNNYVLGTPVKWKWVNGWGEGTVSETFTEKVTKTISGTEVTRNATAEDPAYLIKQQNGDQVLKSHSEVQRAS